MARLLLVAGLAACAVRGALGDGLADLLNSVTGDSVNGATPFNLKNIACSPLFQGGGEAGRRKRDEMMFQAVETFDQEYQEAAKCQAKDRPTRDQLHAIVWRHLFLWCTAWALLAVVIGLYVYHLNWQLVQRQRAASSSDMKSHRDYAMDVVKHFMPSFNAERCIFRGMQRSRERLSIGFDKLGLELKDGTSVLQGVTGCFEAGRMYAIMGPSGAGKTTFMNVLCGKAGYGRMTGSVKINGEEGRVTDYKPVMGFVPQDDVVHERLTVSEQIAFSALLRCPSGSSSEQCQLVTEDVLNVMQIDHIRDSIVGGVEERGISGGQRKRVNIGLELAADPSVLFLDEPTSGLDSTSSLAIIWSLKKMCQLGMTSIMVIHQPRYSLFTLFDDVLLLGRGGQAVYLGSSQQAKGYFEKLGFRMPEVENPADWMMDVVSDNVPNEDIRGFKAEMLFKMWEERESDPPRKVSRGWTMQDDRSVLSRQLEDAWDRIDTNKNGFMEEQELNKLLHECRGREPEPGVAGTLFRAMAKPDAKRVSKLEFLDFLMSLQEICSSESPTPKAESVNGISPKGDEALAIAVPASDEDATAGLITRLGSRFSTQSRFRSTREYPGFWHQFGVLLHRQLVQWWRGNRERAPFLGVVVLAAVVLSVMDTFVCNTTLWSAEPYLNLHTANALLSAVYSLRLFGMDRPVFWRESASGVSVLAFYFSRVIVNSVDHVLQAFILSAIYYLVAQPPLSFGFFFVPFLLVTFAASGVGYFISGLVPPQHGPFIAAIYCFVSCGLMGHPLKVGIMEEKLPLELLTDLTSFTRWSVGMSFIKNLQVTDPLPATLNELMQMQLLNSTYYSKPILQDRFGYWPTACAFLLGMGLTFRVGAYLALRFTHRDKQV